MSRKRTAGSQIVVTDALWVWTKRGITAVCFTVGALWYAFQFYSKVETLGNKVDAQGSRVEALWEGQGTIMKTIAEVKVSIEKLAEGKGKK
jgi:hypothetical protein